MRTSQNGINLIKKFEGCRLTAYKCAAGVPTIGYGHTAGVKMGQKITRVQAESFLKDDLVKYEKKVEKYNSRYGWNQNEFDALVSFAYNVGSIDKLTADGARSRQQIADKFMAYNKAGGKALSGLTARRREERTLFLKDVNKKEEPEQARAESHVQLNYRPGRKYTVQTAMKIRDKPATAGKQTGSLKKGRKIKNQATTRCGEAIWMYFGLDKKGREKWVCADNGKKAYLL